MKTVAEYKNACLQVSQPLPVFNVTLMGAVGCMLADDVRSLVDLPQRSCAAKTGYAVRAEDTLGASGVNPVRLMLESTQAEKNGTGLPLQARHAMRIEAGVPLPPGADAVLSTVYAGSEKGEIAIIGEAEPGLNVHARAQDIAAGQVILRAGIRIGSRQVAVLSSAGQYSVPVHPKPRVVVMSVGDELLAPGKPIEAGKIYDANSHALLAAATDAGAEVFRVGPVSDNPAVLRESLEDQLVRADIIITTGGLVKDGHDSLCEVLEDFETVDFDSVAMSPGERLGVGKISDTTIFCLPGEPVAALICFEIFIRPALRKMAGYMHTERRVLPARMVSGWESPEGLQEFVPAKVGGNPSRGYTAEPVCTVGNSFLSGLSRANCLIAIPADTELVQAGETVECVVLDR
ncbi:gephyrin-like molybdotransferase Glp [Arcanobacterium sp. S3PF19]|uniref:molybdopterin molybdotransferase MoeA n=1 Tax=Arcanobacterium sp. S3PF19 TaxID=1219585 RepID=UPI00050DEAA0|nr:gephyrin-like molybdotransferase Glp [Arcanobacterium sp. S3PF19]KGF05834.1 molybdenum cofactor biosynthesis protein MoaA [Arcanobacterium sp. S3PF19]